MRARQALPAALGGGEARDVPPAKPDAPLFGGVSADQDAEERRLARAVRADDADRLAGESGEIDAVEHAKRAEALAHALRLEDRVGRSRDRSSRGGAGSAVERDELGEDRHIRVGRVSVIG